MRFPRSQRFDRARHAVDCERHQLSPFHKPPPPDQSSSIGDLLPKVLKEFGLEQSWWERDLVQKWPEVVGPVIARVSRPGRYERKTLTIFVNHSTWLSELKRNSERQILDKIARHFAPDLVRHLRFQLDPGEP